MNSRLVPIKTVVLMILVVAVSAWASSPRETIEQRLNAPVGEYSLETKNLLEALARISSDFGLPMGIEWEPSEVPGRPIELSYRITTARQILQDAVDSEPTYDFSVSNGVIHVAKDSTFHDSRNFLNLRIGDFDASSEYVFDLSLRRLHKIVLDETNPTPKARSAGCGGSNTIGAGDQKVSFHLEKPTVRDVLDEFVTSAGFNIWLVTFPGTRATIGRGFFKSVSMFSPDLPDDQLPIWDLLRPGYDPVQKRNGIGWKHGSTPAAAPIR